MRVRAVLVLLAVPALLAELRAGRGRTRPRGLPRGWAHRRWFKPRTRCEPDRLPRYRGFHGNGVRRSPMTPGRATSDSAEAPGDCRAGGRRGARRLERGRRAVTRREAGRATLGRARPGAAHEASPGGAGSGDATAGTAPTPLLAFHPTAFRLCQGSPEKRPAGRLYR